jgi:hypothetical protein
MMEAVGASIRTNIGNYISMVLWNDEPLYIQRIKQGRILPWMLPKKRNETICHASVVTNRMICSMRVQTHTTK